MKKLHFRSAAVLMAAAVSLTSFGSILTASAEDTEEKKAVKLVFDWQEEGVTPGKNTDISLFETTTTTDGHTNIPAGTFMKSGYVFSGWTYDGVEGYGSGGFVNLPSDVDEVVFHICWVDTKEDSYTVNYVLERDGMTFENPEWLESEKYRRNTVFEPNNTTVFVEEETEDGTVKYISRGLTDGERVYPYGTRLVMPDHDITLYPILYRKINLTYFAGDVDRLNGNDTYSFEKTEGTSDELANAQRFSRSGFELVGWLSDYDGKQYKPTETVEMPGVDVVYTAVWKPIEYKVVFIPGNGGENIKIAGETDTSIICPEPGVTVAGKYFAGWKSSEGDIYQPGDEYKIVGALPGMGISLKAVWEAGDAPAQTTTAPAEATTSTTTTTVATTTTTTASEDPADTTTTTDSDQPGIVYGDANCDKKVTVADAVAILQHLGNRDKYGLSELGLLNADVDGEPGVTGKDALVIQQLDAKLIDKFPVE